MKLRWLFKANKSVYIDLYSYSKRKGATNAAPFHFEQIKSFSGSDHKFL